MELLAIALKWAGVVAITIMAVQAVVLGKNGAEMVALSKHFSNGLFGGLAFSLLKLSFNLGLILSILKK